jgi:hypothetical protein
MRESRRTMTQLDWTEWAAIYLQGYNDARGCATKMTAADLSMAWECYQTKRPRMQKSDPRNPVDNSLLYKPTPHCMGCYHPGKGYEHDQFCRDHCRHTWISNGTATFACERCGETR